jgi:hypothetical protein
MRNKEMALRIVVVVVVTLALLSPTIALGDNINRGVVRPDTLCGQLYRVLSIQWWQWAFAQPASVNPLWDTTGEYMNGGQCGSVFFLAGSMNAGTYVRCGRVAEGKSLFFPIYNAFVDNSNIGTGESIQQWGQNPSRATVGEMQELIDGWVDSQTGLTCEVDGVPMKKIDAGATSPYRVKSGPFGYYAPSQPFWFNWGVNGTYDTGNRVIGKGSGVPGEAAVSDGVWLLLSPLSVGRHKIHWNVPDPGFPLDVTYYITVYREHRR